MPDITFVQPDGREQGFEAPDGVSLMQAATGQGVAGIVAECGGAGICCTCHVVLEPVWVDRVPPPSADESALLDLAAAGRQAGSRLACQIRLVPALQGLVARVPERQT